MYGLDGKLPLKIVSLWGENRPKRSQTGVYDQSILCGECDNKIGVWDSHACDVLHSERRKLTVSVADEGPAIDSSGEVLSYSIVGANAELLAKFVLSVLWRCHHSSREEARVVKLGPHADDIRKVLLDDIPIAGHDYSVWLEYHEDFPMVMWIGRWRIMEEMTVNSFMAQGFSFHMKTDKRRTVEPFSMLCLKRDRPVHALAIQKRRTKFGQEVLVGLRASQDKFGDPWKRNRG